MITMKRRTFYFGLIAFCGLALTSCKKDPSVLKVFVRSASNELTPGAMVVVIGDKSANPPADDFTDTLFTNSSGFAEFNMDQYFDNHNEKNASAYFNILIKKDLRQGTGNVKCRIHNTAVETLFLSN